MNEQEIQSQILKAQDEILRQTGGRTAIVIKQEKGTTRTMNDKRLITKKQRYVGHVEYTKKQTHTTPHR